VKPFLRDVADDPAEYEARLRDAVAEKRWVRAGEACRFLGRYDEAITFYQRVDSAAARLAEATALQYRGDHAQAEGVFRALLEGGELRDYVLQHYGKCLVEMGRSVAAIACFEEALALRKGDLAASTLRALEAMHDRGDA